MIGTSKHSERHYFQASDKKNRDEKCVVFSQAFQKDSVYQNRSCALKNRRDTKSDIFNCIFDRIGKKAQEVTRNNQKKVVKPSPMQLASERDIAALNYIVPKIIVDKKLTNSYEAHEVVSVPK